MEYVAEPFDVVVIGAGHAGVEAGLAAARLGVKTALFTLALDAVANLPCNPSIGGAAKAHLVRELDALGGEMGKAADAVTLQSRMLNRGKGPAVHSLRVQADRVGYRVHMKNVVESQPGLMLKQAEIVDIRLNDSGSVQAVVTHLGAVHPCRSVIICTGTFLGGTIYVGDSTRSGGPDGFQPANLLTQRLVQLGIRLRRFKTGTPARVHRRSIDFSKLEIQHGDKEIVPFSYETQSEVKNLLPCHISYTNEKTHKVIRDNLHRSPLYSGKIEGVGPRYCPSIEDKVVRFPDKNRHQVFVEPMGLDTDEMYLQGLSSSLPEDVQIALYRTIEGFENAEIMRSAYAIEYDCADPIQLDASLMFKSFSGLFGAGQFNGTSGYEEAAAQGFVAGVNAAHLVLARQPLVLERSSSYLGTLIDDIVTKGCQDPYRMLTSRSEYRLVLRQDNADARLTPVGRKLGLIGDERWEMFLEKQSAIEKESRRVASVNVPPSAELNRLLEEKGTSAVDTGVKLVELLRRPQLDYDALSPFDNDRPELPVDVTEQVGLSIKYEGYIKKQLAHVEQMRRLEQTSIPEDIDYSEIKGLRLEAREKLSRVRPYSVGQASRISGVSPADISVLIIWLERKRREREYG